MTLSFPFWHVIHLLTPKSHRKIYSSFECNLQYCYGIGISVKLKTWEQREQGGYTYSTPNTDLAGKWWRTSFLSINHQLYGSKLSLMQRLAFIHRPGFHRYYIRQIPNIKTLNITGNIYYNPVKGFMTRTNYSEKITINNEKSKIPVQEWGDFL